MSSRQTALNEIEQTRAHLHQIVDTQMDALILRMTVGDDTLERIQNTDIRVLPLGSAVAKCKGTRPVALSLPSGEQVTAPTWNKVAAAILHDCDADPNRHEMLMEMRGTISGRTRFFLMESPERMRVPIKINDELYVESKFDTPSLLDGIIRKLLRPVGYDYNSVAVFYQDPKQELTPVKHEQDEGPLSPIGPVM